MQKTILINSLILVNALQRLYHSDHLKDTYGSEENIKL